MPDDWEGTGAEDMVMWVGGGGVSRPGWEPDTLGGDNDGGGGCESGTWTKGLGGKGVAGWE